MRSAAGARLPIRLGPGQFLQPTHRRPKTIAFDGNALLAQESRRALLASSAASGQRVYAVHFPFPGLGRFENRAGTFVWVAE